MKRILDKIIGELISMTDTPMMIHSDQIQASFQTSYDLITGKIFEAKDKEELLKYDADWR